MTVENLTVGHPDPQATIQAMLHDFQKSRISESSSFPSAFSSYVPRNRKVYGCICISPCDRILVVKGRISGKWSLPKGHMEGRETDLQCAMRELFEETGITPDVNYSYYKKLAAGGYFIFMLDCEPFPQIQRKEEISEAKWIELSELKQLNCNLDLNVFGRWMRKIPKRPVEIHEDPIPVVTQD